MNWISDGVLPKIKTLFKREAPDNLWIKCPDSGQLVFQKDVEANSWVIRSTAQGIAICIYEDPVLRYRARTFGFTPEAHRRTLAKRRL